MSTPVGLDAGEFARVFPFHVGYDAEGRVVQHGAKLPHLCPGLAVGDALDTHLERVRPDRPVAFGELPAFRQKTFIMRSHARQVRLRGAVVLTGPEGPALFLATPWITSLTEANDIGLPPGEDTMQGGLMDVLFTLSVKETALADAQRLADRLREERAKLETVNVELERASRMKDEFLAAMSHELRTPLNAVLGMSEALAEHAYGDLTRRQHEAAVEIAASGRQLLGLINDILDLSRIGAGKLSVELGPTPLREACAAGASAVAEVARRKGLTLAVAAIDPGLCVVADPRRLRQLVAALAGNAVKFTPAGGRVSVGAYTTDDGEVRLEVTDTGIGIAPADHARIFEPFVQLDAGLDRRFGGTGLGLALVARIAELFGARVAVRSAPGEGSTFTVAFPRPGGAAAPAGESGRQAVMGGRS